MRVSRRACGSLCGAIRVRARRRCGGERGFLAWGRSREPGGSDDSHLDSSRRLGSSRQRGGPRCLGHLRRGDSRDARVPRGAGAHRRGRTRRVRLGRAARTAVTCGWLDRDHSRSAGASSASSRSGAACRRSSPAAPACSAGRSETPAGARSQSFSARSRSPRTSASTSATGCHRGSV